MKKILFCLFLIITPLSAQGFLGEDLGLNLYKSIDSGIDSIEESTYTYELAGESENIKDELNRIFEHQNQRGCIAGDISGEEFAEIVGGDISVLEKKISRECFSSTTGMTITELSQIQQQMVSISVNKRAGGRDKAINIYKNARVGLYSNSNKDDSPFDIISDLEDIDKVIFGEPFEYDGSDTKHIDLFESQQASRLAGSKVSTGAPSYEAETGASESETEEYVPGVVDSFINTCSDPSLYGNLSIESISEIFRSSPKTTIQRQTQTSTATPKVIQAKQIPVNTSTTSSYSPTDQGWGCDEFFCVTIEYITYNHKVLGGSDSFSIKKIIETSNEHLKKFAHTSLIQSKMTKNFFELGLMIDDLPSMLNMGISIHYKPAPIINTNKAVADDLATYGKQNMLEQGFKDLGIEYKTQNNINTFNKIPAETISLLNCGGLSSTCLGDNIAQYNTSIIDAQQRSQALDNGLEQTTLYKGNESLFILFSELDGFIGGLEHYTSQLKPLIKKIKDIPVKKA